MILNKQLTSGLRGSLLQLLEQCRHFGRVEVVDSKSLVDGGLDGVCNSAEAVPELVLDTAQAGVQESGVGQTSENKRLRSSLKLFWRPTKFWEKS